MSCGELYNNVSSALKASQRCQERSCSIAFPMSVQLLDYLTTVAFSIPEISLMQWRAARLKDCSTDVAGRLFLHPPDACRSTRSTSEHFRAAKLQCCVFDLGAAIGLPAFWDGLLRMSVDEKLGDSAVISQATSRPTMMRSAV